MSKWPKEWVLAVYHHTKAIHDYGAELDDIRGKICVQILDDLHKLGALKDPPQPKEIWVCEECNKAYAENSSDEGHHVRQNSLERCFGKMVRYVEAE
jgi:hypothetical protein